jgi:SWI/SNF-related matrix-associated actin-dependent regulator of chromatin subfamily A3
MVVNSSLDYLRNAIQVKNISRVQVGHLPRTVVSKLSPLLDRQTVTVEGVINDGNRAHLQTTMP